MLCLLVQVTDICKTPALNCLQTSITLLYLVLSCVLADDSVCSFMKMSQDEVTCVCLSSLNVPCFTSSVLFPSLQAQF